MTVRNARLQTCASDRYTHRKAWAGAGVPAGCLLDTEQPRFATVGSVNWLPRIAVSISLFVTLL